MATTLQINISCGCQAVYWIKEVGWYSLLTIVPCRSHYSDSEITKFVRQINKFIAKQLPKYEQQIENQQPILITADRDEVFNESNIREVL